MAAHNELGRWGEMIARRFLILHDYNIRSFDWRDGHHELDIVAEKLGFLIFVEVKTRSSDRFGKPEEAIDRDKVRYLKLAANAYMAREKVDMPCRFDVISIVTEGDSYRLRHIKDAVHADSRYQVQEYRGMNESFPSLRN